MSTRGIVSVCIVLEGCGAAAFNCATDDVCDGGLCEPTGYCSFFDPTCPSGRRYGEHSGGLSGQCVPSDDATGDASTSAPGTSSSTASSSESTVAISITGDTTTTSESSSSSSESSSTGDPTIDPSLVAWYRFESELAGVVEDETPNALHGMCDACPMSVEGAIGNAAQYDGMHSVVVADDPLLRTEEAITVAAWVRIDSFDNALNLAIANKVVGTENFNTWELFLGPGQGPNTDQLQWEIFGDMTRTHEVAWETTAVAGDWFHVVGVWEPMVLALYVDGELVASEASLGTLNFDAGDVRIGADFDFGAEGNFLYGALDDVRIYARALPEDEVRALYELGVP